MAQCADCDNLIPSVKAMGMCMCTKHGYVFPNQRACEDHTPSSRYYYDDLELAASSDPLIRSLREWREEIERENQRPKVDPPRVLPSKTFKPANVKKHMLRTFVDILKYNNEALDGFLYRMLEEVTTYVLYRYEKPQVLEEIDKIIHLNYTLGHELIENENIDHDMFIRVREIINAYRFDGYKQTYREWLVFLKFVYEQINLKSMTNQEKIDALFLKKKKRLF
jgi:hypothetical protein